VNEALQENTRQADVARTPLRRRLRYVTRVYHADYFLLKHLSAFLPLALAQNVQAGARVADIGCGEQPLRPEIERLGGTYTGIDMTQNAAGNVDVLAPIATIPLPADSFDLLLCTEVLEHVADTYGAFRELARLLRPGGRVILTTPFLYPLHEEPYDFVRLTPYQIQEACRLHNLRIVSLQQTGNEFEVLATVWSNLWDRLGAPGSRGLAHRAWALLMRLLGNGAALFAGAFFGRVAPRKCFLSVLCVAEKADTQGNGRLV
jgi:SAM-dependent methyltransferase